MFSIRVCMLCVATLIITFLYSIVSPMFMKGDNLNEKKITEDFRRDFHEIDIDWEKEYPFQNTNNCKESDGILKKISVPFMKSTKRVRGGGEVKKIFGEDYGRCMIEYGKKIEMLLGWNVAFVDPKGNHAGKLEDGSLTWYLPRQDIDENIHNVAGVYNKCKEDNIDFLYVIAPPKVNIKQDESIVGKLDFSIQNKDKFVRELISNGVPILDLGYGLEKIYDNHHQMYFRTDHHWKPETALTAAEIVSKDINYKNGYHIDTDKFNADLYEKKIYTKSFLGSQGKKVTLSQVEPDDFILLRPKFAVNVNLKIPSFNVDVTGDFDIMLNPCMYENISGMQLYSANAYGGYLYGDWPVLKIHNYDNNVAHKKILIVKDSFANAFTTFFCLAIEDLELIDLRAFNGSLISYIDKSKPDMVMILTSTETLLPVDYTHHKSLFDYR